MCKTIIPSFDDFKLNEAKISELIDMYNRDRDVEFSVNYKGLNYRTKTFIFDVIGTKVYECRIQIPAFSIVSRMKGDLIDKLKLALEEDIKLNCSCPSFLYSGYKYMGTELDYSIRKENRFPEIRNPNLDGSVCKHLYYLLSNISQFESQMIQSLSSGKENKYGFIK